MGYQVKEGVISFSYGCGDLFRDASLRSTYKSRNIKDGSGRYAGEIYALSRDETDAFGVCLENAVCGVNDAVIKITPAIEGALSVGTEVIFRIADHKAYNRNILANVDLTIKSTLVNGILREWYDICSMPAFFTEYNMRYGESLTELRARLFQLRKMML